MNEICEEFFKPFWTNIWSPADSEQWKSNETGEVIPEKAIDWAVNKVGYSEL